MFSCGLGNAWRGHKIHNNISVAKLNTHATTPTVIDFGPCPVHSPVHFQSNYKQSGRRVNQFIQSHLDCDKSASVASQWCPAKSQCVPGNHSAELRSVLLLAALHCTHWAHSSSASVMWFIMRLSQVHTSHMSLETAAKGSVFSIL